MINIEPINQKKKLAYAVVARFHDTDKAEKQKAVPRNISLAYVLDVLSKQLLTHLDVQEYYRKHYEAYMLRLSAYEANAKQGSK